MQELLTGDVGANMYFVLLVVETCHVTYCYSIPGASYKQKPL